MNTEPTVEFREQAPGRFQLPALVRFLLALALIIIVNLLVPRLTYSLMGDHVVIADTLYRWLGSALLIAGFLFFARVLDQTYGDGWDYIGLPRTSAALRQSLAGLVMGAVLIGIAVAAIAIVGHLDVHASFNTRSAMRLGLVTRLLLGGAMLEELMFRGYPFQRLIESIGVVGAILMLSAFFGAVHLGNPNAGGVKSWGFFNTLAVGVLFAIAYLKTKTLWFPFGIHFGWNFFLGVVFGLPVSGIKDFSVVVHTNAHGPKLLTGGAYGVEASLTGSLVILLGIVVVLTLPGRFLKVSPKTGTPVPESI